VRIARVERLLACLWIALAAHAGAAELGTLFNTPQERARLDSLRRGDEPGHTALSGAATHEITGFVRRSDGRNTVWVDGVAVTVASPAASPIFDPKSVRGYANRDNSALKIERRPAR
jgi:hypothetical protein